MRKRKTEDKKNILSLTVATVAVLISVFWAVFIIVKNVSEKNVFAIYNGEEAVCFVSTRHEAEDAVRLCTEKISSTEVNADFEGITISLIKRFFPETVSSETASVVSVSVAASAASAASSVAISL